jgi:nucleotide-binding universal stress UspA family protein
MKNFKNILCPFDFSNYSEEALQYALQLASDDSKITLFHALNIPILTDPNGMVYFEINTEEFVQGWQTKMDQQVSMLTKAYPQFKIEGIVKLGFEITDAILSAEKEIGANIIIMGSHGRRGLNRMVMGSVAESVLREASCPVLLVRPQKP